MKPVFFYDTETTGLPDWKSPSGSENQPHLVQIGATLADEDTREVISTLDVIIQPDGWVIPEEVAKIHGITTEHAKEVGIPEDEALDQFLQMWAGHKRVAYNRTFDQRIIRIAAKRFSTDDIIERWADKESHDCAMLLAKPIVKVPNKSRAGYKQPKLSEAYEYFTGKELQSAHTAMADAEACMQVYWSILDAQSKAA